MKATEAMLLAMGALVLSWFIELVGAVAVQPPAMGMMGAVGSPYDVPVKMSGQAPACPGYVLATGTLDQTDHGALEGYFAVGQGFDGMMPPANPRYEWVKQFRAQNVEIVLRVQTPRQLEKIR